MNLNDAIKKERIIEIKIKKTNSNDFVYYTGVCLKANKEIWVMVNYDVDKNAFDGFSIFRNSDVEEYSVFKKKYLLKIDETQFHSLKNIIKTDYVNTMYSSLKLASNLGLIAIFLKGEYDGYYIIKTISITKKELTFNTVNVNGKLNMKKRVVLLDNIFYISFSTEYEKKLAVMYKSNW